MQAQALIRKIAIKEFVKSHLTQVLDAFQNKNYHWFLT